MESLTLPSLRNIPWDVWDPELPTLWQISYVNQLMFQTGVAELDIEFTRQNYSEAIQSLLNLRHHQRRTAKRDLS